MRAKSFFFFFICFPSFFLFFVFFVCFCFALQSCCEDSSHSPRKRRHRQVFRGNHFCVKKKKKYKKPKKKKKKISSFFRLPRSRTERSASMKRTCWEKERLASCTRASAEAATLPSKFPNPDLPVWRLCRKNSSRASRSESQTLLLGVLLSHLRVCVFNFFLLARLRSR